MQPQMINILRIRLEDVSHTIHHMLSFQNNNYPHQTLKALLLVATENTNVAPRGVAACATTLVTDGVCSSRVKHTLRGARTFWCLIYEAKEVIRPYEWTEVRKVAIVGYGDTSRLFRI